MLNRITIAGRLTRDPELHTTKSGVSVANFRVAVDRNFKAADGSRETDFIDCVAWRGLADKVAQTLTKGRLITVDGRLQIREYETQDGQKRRVAEIVADEFDYMDKKPATAEVSLPDDIPF
jgi:single-strand DNA-binding protein